MAAAVGALTLVHSVSARPTPPYSPYAVTLEDERGNTLRTFRHDGATFVLGYVGERYNVRLSNRGDRRVEAVLSVDGRDAVSGDAGDFVHARGYLVPPHGSVVVDGFRQSLEQTAAFRFSRPGASYSSRMGTPENVGVIGVAFFAEQRPRHVAPPPYVPYTPYYYDARPRADRSSSGAGQAHGAAPSPPRDEAARGAPAPSSPAKRSARLDDDLGARPRSGESAAPSRLGTEYGEPTYSPVTEVPFQRENSYRPDAVVSLRYDDADGLVARGFDVYPRAAWTARGRGAPDPFPESHFAAPPR
ncbi:MAG TPA: hypothetical protein VHU80_03550 [Polyangiaceae bacterium]|nr:hypothetical protein [Polyangiaceae bacterium]